MSIFLLLLFLLPPTSPARYLPVLGYRYFEVRPNDPHEIEFSGGMYRTVYYWEGERDDDPSIIIRCRLWGIEYIYKPNIVNSAFPVGDTVTLLTDAPIKLQVWVFPIGFCSPITHYYSIGHSFSNHFTLSENISNLCLFFENPSRDTFISARILSKRVNFSESRIEIWDSDFVRVPCHKHKCAASLRSKFFIRIVEARSGFKIALSGRFQRNDLGVVCGRESVTVWDANLSYSANLDTADERFFCDDAFTAEIQRQWIVRGICVAILAICGGVGGWMWTKWKKEKFTHVPAQLKKEYRTKKRLRGGETFKEDGNP